MAKLVFWQAIVTPHMLGLADAMIARGHDVLYAAESQRCSRRSVMGWPERVQTACVIKAIPTKGAAAALAAQSPPDAVHLFQGLRGNSVLSAGWHVLLERNAQIWCMLEKVDERGVKAWLRGIVYRQILRQLASKNVRLLPIGIGMRAWLLRHGACPQRTHDFAYFLASRVPMPESRSHSTVRFAYVGQLIPRKRVDLLLDAVSRIDSHDYELQIIGDGPEALRLKHAAVRKGIAHRITWLGVRPMSEVRGLMESFDRVILPSDHDGWGAVVSEALISGTPVFCSDRCGAAAAIFTPDMGAVFRHGDPGDLHQKLFAAVEAGPVGTQARATIQTLAQALTAESGAEYLDALLAAAATGAKPPDPPWRRRSESAEALP